MYTRDPQKWWSPLFSSKSKLIVGFFVVSEISGLAFVYATYRHLNHNPDVRYSLYRDGGQIANIVLNAYYLTGERINPNLKIRENDRLLWQSQGKEL